VQPNYEVLSQRGWPAYRIVGGCIVCGLLEYRLCTFDYLLVIYYSLVYYSLYKLNTLRALY